MPQVRTLIQRELEGVLVQYDALLCPAAPTLAYKLGEKVRSGVYWTAKCIGRQKRYTGWG